MTRDDIIAGFHELPVLVLFMTGNFSYSQTFSKSAVAPTKSIVPAQYRVAAGAMVLYRAREKRFEVIDFGMCAPQGLNPADYALTGEGAGSDLFPWPRVKDDRNLHGPGSVAVPGVVAGMEAGGG